MYLTTRARSLLRSDRSRAEGLFRAAVRADATLADPHRELAKLHAKEGRLGQACEQLRRFLQVTKHTGRPVVARDLERWACPD